MDGVAIIGAGIAGLSCAVELERKGIRPVIFEQKHQVGSPFTFAPLLLNFMVPPMGDPAEKLKQEYQLALKTLAPLKSLMIKGPNAKYAIKGRLGHILLRGQGQQTIESQLSGMLKTPVRFQNYVKPEELLKDFNYLVVADGTNRWAKKLHIWQSAFQGWVRGATILGKFNPFRAGVWVNTDYCKGGLAYLAPMSSQKASLVLIVPNIQPAQLNSLWQKFLKEENIRGELVELWDVDYETGLLHTHRVGNTFFTGNSGGFVSSWFGSGVFTSIISGIQAARSIAGNADYEKNMGPYSHLLLRHTRFQKFWHRLDNRGIDRMLRLIFTPPLKQIFFHSNLNLLRVTDPLFQHLLKGTKDPIQP
ncbi:NAD(P)/FAD-dependent oxidoreductase [Desulforamulus ruminis]|uniref:FAD dependent oxidoreductase n=1 Tax=Desulforamulus ruminis (strain ATCC 23193 / DSM 2154 / NCIMB 8452 / DL) TaxID=696281 RepID=F6DSG1_DESRL|nr:FAD-dependent oxidoreductase [Desulforamulus ruminis]AEG61051.1 FAD dependent oxidoreductase [Desulforamulus ruminis DSM 2154]